ncbi:MAG: flagellar hook-associated protein FlgK [Planctomycetota bacterium]|jgi:flagellar hook-associated protein FlgK
MSNLALNTGLRALTSAQFLLDTVGHNISNANTPGYSRQRVEVTAARALPIGGLLIGNGVDANSVQRTVDNLLNNRIRTQTNSSAALGVQFDGLQEIESVFDEPSESSISGLLDGFFSSISELTSDPGDPIRRTAAVQAAVSLTSQINGVVSRLDSIVDDSTLDLRTRVDEANGLAQRIADLNVQIGETQAVGLNANDLADARDRALGALAELVDVKTIDGQNGAVNVLVAGNTLVGASRANAMEVDLDSNGNLRLSLAGSTGYVPAKGGSIGGLIGLSGGIAPGLRDQLNEFASSLIQEVNRVHSKGIPADGPMTQLTAAYGFEDQDGDGRIRDELVARGGLPFDISSGDLRVNVTNLATGRVEGSRIPISSTHTTVDDLLESLNEVDGLSAELDSADRLRIVASAGFGFDFSTRLDTSPDMNGTFGGGNASLGSAVSGPFAFADGDDLQLTVDPGGAAVPISIAFSSSDFKEISQATAEEIAAVINANADAQGNGIRAVSVDDDLFLQTAGTGADVDFQLDGGAAATSLGWAGLVGSTVSGHDRAVTVTASGSFTGSIDEQFTFRPTTDGTIGTTDNLFVEVFDSKGAAVGTFDVGNGYEPGSELEIAGGIFVSFGLGELSATNRDSFQIDAVADSDTAGLLVGAGLNSLFTGTDALDIAVRSDLESDPGLLAASQTGADADTGLLLRLLDVEDAGVRDLGDESLGSYYGGLVGDLGFQTATTLSALESNELLISSLEQRRDQISGVNVDEELVDLVRYEQAFAAAAQFMQTVNQLGDELLNLL